MTNKEWALANLTGKVLNRALRAIEEQDFNIEGERHSVRSLFGWLESKEGPDYWIAISDGQPDPDQFLPLDYVEAPEYVGEVEAKDEFLEWLRQERDASYNESPNSDKCTTYIKVLRKYEQLKK